jgi:hypothetical protein
MAIKVQDAGTLRTITGIQVKQSGIVRDIKQVKVQDGGVLRTVATFADPLAVSSNSPFATAANSTLTTNTATATPTGGFSPYTYAWTLVTNGGGTASTASSASTASTTFTKTGVPSGTDITDFWKVTVTDSLGSTAEKTVDVVFSNISGA